MSQVVTRCPEQMPIETLTAWYDHEMAPDEAQRVRVHVRTCPACQRRLDEYGADTDRLRDFNPPDLYARIWRGVQQDIVHGRRRSLPRGVIGGVGAAAVLVALAVLLFTQILAPRPGTTTSMLPITGTATQTLQPPTATAHPTQGSPTPTGTATSNVPWHPVGPNFAQNLALAASDPQTLMSCGFVNTHTNSFNNPVGALALGISHDGGQTWLTTNFTYQGTACTVTISPTNPRDLVVFVDACGDACVLQNTNIYRSQDGGATLAPVSLPGGAQANGTGAVWLGSALWLAVAHAGAFMVSRNGGPFTNVAINLPPPQSGAVVQSISQLVATRTALFASVMYAVPGSRPTTEEVQTLDGGATWATFTSPFNIFGVSTDGTVLLGSATSNESLAISHDDGATWTRPAPDPVMEWVYAPFATPDGTIVVVFSPAPNNNDQRLPVYRLRPGATTWTKILPNASSIPIAGVTADAAGHPVALWGVVQNQAAYIMLS